MVGQEDGEVVELERDGVGKGEDEYRERLLCVKTLITLKEG